MPPYVEVQLQHQLEVADQYEWGCVVAFTGIYDFVMYERERDREFGQAIKRAISKFWDDVEQGNEPRPNFYRDGEIIKALYSDDNGEMIDKTGDEKIEALASRFLRWKQEASNASAQKEAAKTELFNYLENNKGCFTDKYRISCGWTKDSQGTLVTEDMVGTHIGARKGYRRCDVKDLTEKKEK